MFGNMNDRIRDDSEAIQGMIVRTLATNPAGHRLCLIGGFRYRLLDGSARRSIDVDYHWEGDIEAKQQEVIALLQTRLLPDVQVRYGYEGAVGPVKGPDAESPLVRTIETVFRRVHTAEGAIVIPVEITRIVCLDPAVVRTVKGTVCLTASDADMIESKVISLLNRVYVRAQDFVDLFLFQDAFIPDSNRRLRNKLSQLKLPDASIEGTMSSLLRNRVLHIRAIEQVLEEQVDEAVAATLREAGGGSTMFDTVYDILGAQLRTKEKAGS